MALNILYLGICDAVGYGRMLLFHAYIVATTIGYVY